MLRSILAIVAGILVASLIVEPLEFALVALVNGAPTTDPAVYLATRNQPGFLIAKLAYNGVGGVGGGYVAAWVADRRPIAHAVTAAVLQGALLALAASDASMRLSTPGWAWIGIGLTTCGGLVLGGWIRSRVAAR